MREHHGEQRRRRVENRREAARDSRLAPEDQAERYQVVERAHDQERAPQRHAARHALPARVHREHQRARGDADAGKHQRERPHLGERHLGEEEGAAPQARERDQQRPIRGPHRASGPVARHVRSPRAGGYGNGGPGRRHSDSCDVPKGRSKDPAIDRPRHPPQQHGSDWASRAPHLPVAPCHAAQNRVRSGACRCSTRSWSPIGARSRAA